MVAKETAGNNPTEKQSNYTEEERRNLNSISDVLAAAGGSVTVITDVLGDGFSVLEDKTELLDTEFVVIEYSVHESEQNGGEFSTLHVITAHNEKLIVNDGSTGIHEQCQALLKKTGKVAPLHVPRGLRVSNYTFTGDDGKPKKASTFYLSTAK